MSNDDRTATYVYFVKNPTTGLVKVGFTKDPKRRFRELEQTEGCRLEMLGFCDGGWHTEQRLHKGMAAFRDHGEWFRPNSLISAYLHAIALLNDDVTWKVGVDARAHAAVLSIHPERITPVFDATMSGELYWGPWTELLA